MTIPAYQTKTVQLIGPVGSSSAITNSSSVSVDVSDCGYATILVGMSSEVNTHNAGVTLSLQEDDTTVITNAATIVADVTVDNTNESQHTYHVDMRGRKKYLFLKVTPDTVASNGGVEFTAGMIKYRLKEGPASTSDMVSDTTNDSVTVV